MGPNLFYRERLMSQRAKISTAIFVLAAVLLAGSGVDNPKASAQSQAGQAFRELLERSEKDKKGLTFFVRGQTISGIVVKMVGSEAVEVIIKLESIDVLAIN
jgi:hypothetical protein